MAMASACSGSTPQSVSSGNVNLQFWAHDPGLINTFKAAIADKSVVGKLNYNYGLTVVQASAADILTREISQAAANATVADLLGIVNAQFPRVMTHNLAQNLFMDLTDVTKPFGDKLLRTEPYSVDGKVYGLETDLSVTVQYYRADVFDKNKISTDIATWDEWLQAGSELNAKTGQFLGVHHNGDNQTIFNQFFQFLLQRGGKVFDQNGNFALQSQEALDVLAFMRKGIEVKAFTQTPDPYGSATAAALKESSLAAIAMPSWYEGSSLKTNVPDQAGKWRIRSLPTFSQGGHKATTLGGTGFAVGKDKPNSQAALDLLKATYLTPEGQLLRFKTAGFLPTLTDLYSSTDFLNYQNQYLGGQKSFEVYAAGAKDLPTFYQNQNMTVLPNAAGGPILNVLKGTMSPQQALDQITKSYQQAAVK